MLQRTHGSLAAYNQAQFEAHMAKGTTHLKQNEPAAALDAFTLAAQYGINHAQAMVGKSFALLAQGEYTGSALFLGRALKTMPEYAGHPSVLTRVLGLERVKQCCLALQSLLMTVSAPELHFLLGYLQYQRGDVSLAYESLQQAQASDIDVPGLRILLAVIEARLSQ